MKEVKGGMGGSQATIAGRVLGSEDGGCKAIEGGMGGLTTCAGTIRVDCRRG